MTVGYLPMLLGLGYGFKHEYISVYLSCFDQKFGHPDLVLKLDTGTTRIFFLISNQKLYEEGYNNKDFCGNKFFKCLFSNFYFFNIPKYFFKISVSRKNYIFKSRMDFRTIIPRSFPSTRSVDPTYVGSGEIQM